jgi:phospholipid/cholesterol/gamma-HCH transport system substrate-binding protein
MDKKIANNLIVGVFVIVGTIAFLFVLFNIGEGHGVFSRQDSLFATFSHVKGLNFGSEVSLSGLRIGTVKRIFLKDPASKELTVEMEIDRGMFDKIREDSVASILTSGVLGDKYVEISIGSPSAPPLKNGATISSSEPEDLFKKGGTLMESLAAEFKRGGDIHSMIQNLNKVSQNLAVITSDIKERKGMLNEVIYGKSGAKLAQTMDNLEKSTQNIQELTKKINSGTGSLGALINDPTVYEDLKAMMGGARRSSVLKYFMQKFIQDGASAPKSAPSPSK